MAGRGFRRLSTAIGICLAVLVGTVLPAFGATGVDVASWQHPGGAAIDWPAVRGAGHTFAFIKADEGPSPTRPSYYTNPYHAGDWADAAAAGMYRGAYHYAQPRLPISTAVEDARHMVSVTGTMRGPTDLPPVLDLEEHNDLGTEDLTEWTGAWLAEMERLTGRKAIIYMSYYFWVNHLANTTRFADHPLWIAQWTSAAAPSPMPGGWETWTFWQYTATGTSPGIQGNVDLNRFCCHDDNLAALADGAAGDQAGSNPFGYLDTATVQGSNLTVTGWAIDPDTRSPIDVDLYVDDAKAPSGTADRSRPDVAAAYPGWSDAHGFDLTVPMTRGPHTVCAYALNQGPGTGSTHLGCRDFEVASGPNGFTDVHGWSPFVTEISWLVDRSIAEGYGDGSFRPAEPITRQAMAAFLARYADHLGGIEPQGEPIEFLDVPADHPFHAEIAWLSSSGVTTGFEDQTFRPTDPITRQAMAAFLARLEVVVTQLDLELSDQPASFWDVGAGHPFYDEIAWLAGQGITEGFDDGSFRPLSPVTRQAMAAFLNRFDAR